MCVRERTLSPTCTRLSAAPTSLPVFLADEAVQWVTLERQGQTNSSLGYGQRKPGPSMNVEGLLLDSEAATEPRPQHREGLRAHSGHSFLPAPPLPRIPCLGLFGRN